jgi:hypothetical protein
MGEDEVRLDGGERTDVRRRGGVVLREARPSSATVLGLLRHLEAVGFDGAPRVVGEGFDERGREALTYVEGGFVHPQAWSDAGVAALGGLLRRLHDAAASHVPAPGATWQPRYTRQLARPPALGPPVAGYGHGDLGPWNVVSRDGLPVAFIDWEYAGPMDPLVDLAECAWLNVQLHDDDVAERQGLGPPEQRARQLRLLVDGYGLPAAERGGFVQLMIDVAVLDAAWEAIEAGITPGPPASPASPGPRAWAVAWRARSASWMTRHRSLLEAALTDR